MNKSKLRVLGIDPGLASTGWAVVEKVNSEKLEVKSYGCIKTEPNLPLSERLLKIYTSLEKVIKKQKPKIVSIERQFFWKNSASVVSASEARGIVLLLAARNHLKINEYSPKEIKIAVTGYGGADKSQLQDMLKRLLNLETIPNPDDISDAIAVAICCLNTKLY